MAKSPPTELPGGPTSLTQRGRRKRNLSWDSLISSFEAGDFLVIPLTCSDDLCKEGEEMNHCVGRRYHRWCHVGAVRVFSIRDLDDRRLATASIFFDFEVARWRLEQCKGFDNIEVCVDKTSSDNAFLQAEPSELYFVVQYLVVQYQKAQDNIETDTVIPRRQGK